MRKHGLEPVVAAGGEVSVERVGVLELEARGDDARPVAGVEPRRPRIGDGGVAHVGALMWFGGFHGQPHRLGGDVVGRHGADGAVGGDALTYPGERAVRWDLAVEHAGAQVVDEPVEHLVGHAEPVAVVDLQRRRLGARRLALGVGEGDQPVGRGAAGLDAQLLLGVVHQVVRAEQRARHRVADVDQVLADRLELEHLVERGRAEHLGRGGADQLADVHHGLVGDVAVLLLGHVEQGDRRRPRLRVAGDDLLGQRHVGVVQPGHYRSTSPRTGSTEEMTATASAIRPPCIMCGRHWMLTKLGPRMCSRYGLAPPSLAM